MTAEELREFLSDIPGWHKKAEVFFRGTKIVGCVVNISKTGEAQVRLLDEEERRELYQDDIDLFL